ncbi:MAG: hypothetical protein ACRD0P_02365 [Stackebrandtia sp.]
MGVYELSSADDRLSGRDRVRALLWTGTVATKQLRCEGAVERIQHAVQVLDELCEVGDWATAHQKLALAYRIAGDWDAAMECIAIAESAAPVASALHRVRLQTARGHILLSDAATASQGEAVLEAAWRLASQYGLAHQRQAIETIRARGEQAGAG